MKQCLIAPLDALDLLMGRRADLVPPRYLRFAGDGDFEATGDEFFQYFVDLGGLKPGDKVLEIGCGIGRMARPLTKYLTGTYDGVDIVPKGIRWCTKNITRRFPNFRFHLADLQNKMYNPGGHTSSAQFQFPFREGEFDFVYLTSVFTHMLRRDVEHYLAEIARMMLPGGRCLTTFFLINSESQDLLSKGLSSLDFPFLSDGCWLHSQHLPEHAVAFGETAIRDLYALLGFTVDTIRYGGWCGRNEHLSYQDIVVARKN